MGDTLNGEVHTEAVTIIDATIVEESLSSVSSLTSSLKNETKYALQVESTDTPKTISSSNKKADKEREQEQEVKTKPTRTVDVSKVITKKDTTKVTKKKKKLEVKMILTTEKGPEKVVGKKEEAKEKEDDTSPKRRSGRARKHSARQLEAEQRTLHESIRSRRNSCST